MYKTRLNNVTNPDYVFDMRKVKKVSVMPDKTIILTGEYKELEVQVEITPEDDIFVIGRDKKHAEELAKNMEERFYARAYGLHSEIKSNIQEQRDEIEEYYRKTTSHP